MHKQEIESGIEIPPRSKWASVLREMKVGDSTVTTIAECSAIRAQAWKLGMAVESRTVEPNKIRVWRTK